MTFEDQLNALIFSLLEEHTSARHLVQTLKEDDFARNNIAPEGGISQGSFSKALNERGLEQFMAVSTVMKSMVTEFYFDWIPAKSTPV